MSSNAPKPAYEKEGNQLQTILNLFPHLWPKGRKDLRVLVTLSLICLVAAKVVNTYMPFLYGWAIDAMNLQMDSGVASQMMIVPVGLVLAYGLARIFSIAFGEIRDALFARVSQNAVRKVALSTFKHLHALSLRFHLDRQTGGLNRAIERGVKGIEFVLNFVLFNIIPTLIEILMVTVVLWVYFDWRFAIVTFTTVIGYIVFTISITEWRIAHRRAMNKSDSEANTKAIDSLLNYETVKYFNNESHESARYDIALQGYEKAAVRNRVSLSLLNVGQAFIIAVGVTLVMLMGAFGVKAGTMTIGGFVMVNTFLIQLYLPLNFLGFVYREIKQSLIDMEYMFNILGVNQEIADKATAKPIALDQARLVFDGVNFSYNADRQILKNLNFEIPAGQTVAVVGPSGSGKSTIARLLFRFYDIDSGSIKIDDQDLRDVQQQSLRAEIGIVPQDTVLFNDTIAYNIGYGRVTASQDEIVEAAKLASIHDFILGLPDGYETRVGERGLKLSGGERQRVAIARTILKQPRILMFDEATSALDSATEDAIQEALDKVSADRTTLVIAHRLSTIVNADKILVLEKGALREQGTHRELLEKNGLYAEMWYRQQDGNTEEQS
ncbi:MAG: ABCB family ABC transporter ATP-binding protein/permease [Alphaproteobacteria bacterium]